MQLQNVTIVCFFASYFLALVLELAQFIRQSRAIRWTSLILASAGLLAQTIYLVERSKQADLPPLLASRHDWFLVSAWLVIVLYLAVKIWDRTLSIGVFFLPLVLGLVVASQYVAYTPNPRVSVAYWWTLVHASFWVLGILGVILALLVSAMYLLQHYRLRHKKVELPALHLLSLERLNRINWWLITLSVPLLTLGMVTGLWMSYLSAKSANPVDLSQFDFLAFAGIWVAMTLLFGWLLVAKHATGKLVASRTVLACIALLTTLFAVTFLSADGIHAREMNQEAHITK